jgi:hypothetical protein
MSKVNVNTIEPSTGTDITLGASGDTITVPSGATIVNSGTSTGFGATLSGSTNNTVVTVTGANAMIGEANLTFDGTDLTLGTGNIVFGTAAKGVYLGVTSATAANLLDDYEEGTWTPTFDHGGDATGVTYAQQMGYYTKIGRVVSYNFGLVLTAKGSGTGHTRVDGLPFSSVNAGYDEPPAVLKFSNISNAYSMIGLTASTRMSFWGTDTDDSGTGPLYKGNFDDNFECYGAGVYITAA